MCDAARHRAPVAVFEWLQSPHEYHGSLAQRITKTHFLLVAQAQVEHRSLNKEIVLLVPPRYFHRIAASMQEIHKLPPGTQSAYAPPNGLSASTSQIITLARLRRAGTRAFVPLLLYCSFLKHARNAKRDHFNRGLAESG